MLRNGRRTSRSGAAPAAVSAAFPDRHPMVSFGGRAVRRGRSGSPFPVADSQRPALHVPLAYIDPGSGSLIVQAVIAGAVGSVVVLRTQIRRVAGTVRRLVGRDPERTKE